ncbi:MAG: DUF6599 family protein [Terracidiphilus sp.]
MRWMAILVGSVMLAGGATVSHAKAAPAKAAPAKAHARQGAAHVILPPVPKALLPEVFAGWVATGTPKKLTDPAQADPVNAAALKEYEFTDALLAVYKRSGETLSLRALRFHDTSGAYGAYSFYRQNGWPREQIGTGATSDNNRVIFWEGDIVVDAIFSHIGPMSGAELRELAGELPAPEGGKAVAPPVLANLPKAQLDGQTTHYALGPAGYAGAGGVLPPELVGFDLGAEAVTANYSLRTGQATLTIIDYPTPQLAAAQETRIRAFIEACKRADKQAQATWPKPLQDSGLAALEARRSGPLVALVSGNAFTDDSHKLLASVHYESELTSLQQPGESEVLKTGKLLLGITILVLIGCSASLLLAFFLSGFRALYRMARGRPVSSVYDIEFISLNLRDWEGEKIRQKTQGSIRRVNAEENRRKTRKNT